MSWFRRRNQLSGQQMARILHEILVLEPYPPLDAHHFNVPEAAMERYLERVLLYREALVLLLLVERGPTSPAHPTLVKYEQILFGGLRLGPAADRAMSVKRAMNDLADLLIRPGERRELSWGRRWIAEIGYDETDPATLVLFYVTWAKVFIQARESLEELLSEGHGAK